MERLKLLCLILAMLLLACAAFAQNAQDGGKPADKPSAAKPADPKADKPSQPASPAKGAGLTGKILLPSKGSYTWWATGAAGDVLASPTSVEADSIDIKLSQPSAPKAEILVLNEKSGNVASLPAATIAKAAETKLVESDFNLVHRVKVTVRAKSDRPVRSASVVLNDEQGGRQTVLIEPADKGVATFKDVPVGKLDLKASYGDTAITQQSALEASRRSPEASLEMILPGDVPTLEDAEANKADSPKPEQPAPARSRSALSWLIPLLILAIIVAVAVLVAKNRKVTLKQVMEKAGVALEENQPVGNPAGQTAPPGLDPELVGPAPGSPPAASTPAVGLSGPRLVGVNGSYNAAIFAVAGSVASIGRDPNMDVALVDDSTASRRHARITCTDGVCTIHDEGSSNGTFVNGKKVSEQELTSGDEVQIGSTRFRFEC